MTVPIQDLYSSYTSSDYSQNSSGVRFSAVCDISKIFDVASWNGLSILDFGCGPANFTRWLDERFVFSKYFGYDIRKETIAYNNQSNWPKNVRFSSDLPQEKFDISVLLGTISYKYSDTDRCKIESSLLLKSAFSLTAKAMFFTLPRKYNKEPNKPMITYSVDEVFLELSNLSFSKCVLDLETFPHEFIVGVKK